ncbi:glycosyltransferase family 9 protein [Aromatoleum sp.]|uniref:glycosyltransferase family 9 protein n=1 Tax=Aromatoleum sp. TaxID=2307007 RepID=UPI002FC6E6F5
MEKPLLPTLQSKSIAIFRALQLGDMLCATPALRALRAACPHARITLIGLPWAKVLVARYPRYLDDFIAFPGFPGMPEQAADTAAFPAFLADVRARSFDLAIQMHGDGRITNGLVREFGVRCTAGFGIAPVSGLPGFLPYPEHGAEIRRLLALTDFLGAPAQGDHLEFPLNPSDEAELLDSGVATGLAPGRYICLHAGARSEARRWPPEHFAAVGDRLYEAHGLPLVLTGSQFETGLTAAVRKAMRAPAVDAAAPISAGALAALLRGARLLVCNDTGVAHIAAALHLPSVIVFRASDISRWAPLDRTLHRPVWAPGDRGLSEVLREARTLLKRSPPGSTDRARVRSPLPC